MFFGPGSTLAHPAMAAIAMTASPILPVVLVIVVSSFVVLKRVCKIAAEGTAYNFVMSGANLADASIRRPNLIDETAQAADVPVLISPASKPGRRQWKKDMRRNRCGRGW
jgi:hypothetical protein